MPQRQPNVVPRQIVGKGVVDRRAAVFVRAFHKEAGILVFVRLPGKAAEPVARRFQIHLRKRPVQRTVAGDFMVSVRRVGHVGGDVRFAQADVPALALLAPILAAHPWIARAAEVLPPGQGARRVQAVQPVAHEVSRGIRPVPAEEGKQKHIRVPKDVALVPPVRQPPRADGDRRVIRRVGAEHLKDVVTHRPLDAPVRVKADVAVPPQGFPSRGVLSPGVACVWIGRFAVQKHAHALFHREALARPKGGAGDLRRVRQDAKFPSRADRPQHQLLRALAHGRKQPHGLRLPDHLVVVDGQVAHLRIQLASHLRLRVRKGRQHQTHAQKLPVGHAGHALRLHGHGPSAPALGEYPRAQVQLLRNLRRLLPCHAQAQGVGELHHIRHAGTDGLEEPSAEHGMIVRAALGRLQAEAPHAQMPIAHRKQRLRIIAHRAVQRNAPWLDAHLSHRSSRCV